MDAGGLSVVVNFKIDAKSSDKAAPQNNDEASVQWRGWARKSDAARPRLGSADDTSNPANASSNIDDARRRFVEAES